MKTTTEQTKEPITNVSEIDAAKRWWGSLNYSAKKNLCNCYIMPTDSALDPAVLTPNEDILMMYKNENVSETVEEALRKQWFNVGYSEDDSPLQTYIAGGRFAANWQKEQLATIIKELVEALKIANLSMTDDVTTEYVNLIGIDSLAAQEKIESAQSKANEYLQGKS